MRFNIGIRGHDLPNAPFKNIDDFIKTFKKYDLNYLQLVFNKAFADFNIKEDNLITLAANLKNNDIKVAMSGAYFNMIHPDKDKNLIMLDLMSKNSASTNSIGLPIADSFNGSLNGCPDEFTIAESSFRLFNILRTTNSDDLNCFYNKDNKVFLIDSSIKSKEGYKIHSRFIVGLIKGK